MISTGQSTLFADIPSCGNQIRLLISAVWVRDCTGGDLSGLSCSALVTPQIINSFFATLPNTVITSDY